MLVKAFAGGGLLPPFRGQTADLLIKGAMNTACNIHRIGPMIEDACVAVHGLIDRKVRRQREISAANGCS